MIEVGGSIAAFIFVVVFMIGYSKEKKRLQEYSQSYGIELSKNAEADLYAAYTYQETGEPSAFMLFDYEEPAVAPPVVQAPKRRPKPKPKASAQDKKIKSLENQIKQLQKMVANQQSQPVKNVPKVHPLQQDCVDALVTLGYNKTEAKSMVKNNLTEGIKTVQQFIEIAMRR